MIAAALVAALPWLAVAVLILNMAQRRHGEAGHGRRLASLYLAFALGALYAAAAFVLDSERIARLRLNDLALIPPAALIGFMLWTGRGRVFPYRLRCPGCRARLPLEQLLLQDDSRCQACRR